MSHIRNLLHKASGHEQIPMPASQETSSPATTVAEKAAPSVGTAAAIAPSPLECPVEEVHLGSESKLVFHTALHGAAADRFRLLRMRLKEHWAAGKLKKLLITGPTPRDGKTTVVLNLATALAERGSRTVLVVEADLHRSTIAQTLNLKPCAGLSECLADKTSPFTAIRRIEPLGWYLLQAGEPPRKNPTELLQTPAFGHMIQTLSPHFDWILIDSPPVVPLTDALSMQQHVDASLLVVRAGETPKEAIDQAVALLGKKNIVGMVLNAVEVRDTHYYQYYGSEARPTGQD